MHRRRLISTVLAAAGVAVIPYRVVAQMTAGGGTVASVRDGHLVLPLDMILGHLPAEQLAPILAAHDIAGGDLTPPCNVTLYRDEQRTVLFDVGAGWDFMATTGELVDNLDALGIAPEEVTDVVFTHAHPDHLWGLVDDFDEVAFPEAAFHIGRTEYDYWADPATVGTIGAERQSFAVGAARRLERIADRVRLFGDGEEVLPGIEAVASFGHTPGHMAFQLGGAEGVMVIGDAIANHHVAFARPDWHTGNDQDPAAAAATRVRLLDRLATDRLRIVGFHLPGDGIGRVEREGDGYRFVREG